MNVTVCAVLAAGISSRMGRPKLLVEIGGRTLLERALETTRGFPTIVVVAPALASYVAERDGLSIVVNDEPERGMTHSVRLADAAFPDREAALAVILADTPFAGADLLARVVAARGDADVAYPVRNGVGGHPVVFGPLARTALAGLEDGDTLRVLRDDARWRRVTVEIEGDAPFLDIDVPADIARAASVWSSERK